MFYSGRVLGVYSSWHTCHEQVFDYKDSPYKGFQTRKGAQDDYSRFVIEQKTNVDVERVQVKMGCVG